MCAARNVTGRGSMSRAHTRHHCNGSFLHTLTQGTAEFYQ